MGDIYQYLVFFESQSLLQEQVKRIETYFHVRRRSGGGDCGPLTRVNDHLYSLAFRYEKDQQAVLERCEHVVDGLVLAVRGSLEPHNSSPSQDFTAPVQSPQSIPASTPQPSGEEYELQLDSYLLRYLKESPKAGKELEKQLSTVACSAQLFPEEGRVLVSHLAQPGAAAEVRNWKAEVDKLFDGYQGYYEVNPHKVKALLQSCSSPQTTDEKVKVYSEAGMAVVVGERSQVKARLMDVEDLLVKRGSRVSEKQTSLRRDFPGLMITQAASGQFILEGSPEEIVKAGDLISDLETERYSQSPTGKDELPNVAHELASLSLTEGNTTVATYSLRDGFQVLVCQGDITKQDADALVNAANEDLEHGGGVAAALSKAGGPQVQKESRALVKQIGKIPTGDVVVTTGGNLKCKRLLHAVGPIGGKSVGKERILLEKTVQSALNLAEMMEFRSIAMPCISSGSFGVPVTVCSEAIVSAVKEFGSQGGRSLSRIILIDNRGEVVRVLQEACDRLLQGTSTRNSAPSDVGFQRGATSGAPEGGVHVEIVQGTIETQQVDALVSPMVNNEPLSTRVGNTLFKVVGPHLTVKFRQEAGGDTVLVEGLSGLPFDAVFFLNLLPWDEDPDGTAVQVLRLAINNILTSCENRRFRSVALPVLGAGIALRFPDSVVARVLLEQVRVFEQNRDNGNPFLVRIVIHPNDTEASEVFKSVQQAFQLTRSVHQPDQGGKKVCLAAAPIHSSTFVVTPVCISKLGVYQPSSTVVSTTRRIILLGKTGAGKSNLANTIFGEQLFATNHTPNSGTKKCQAETKSVNGRSITLIDTPGFFDAGGSKEELKPEIVRCITECAPGPHAFLIVLKVEKFTEHEQAVITEICQYFSEEALKYATVVFTHGDQLSDGMTIEEFVSENENLSGLVKKCGGRCHVMDNKYWKKKQQNNYRSNRVQVEDLLNTVDKMIMENNGGCYTNEVFQEMEKVIQIEIEHIKQNTLSGNMPPEEIRKQAKSRVSQKLLNQLAGTATGVLIGAFLGVAVMVGLVVTAVQNCSGLLLFVKKARALGAAAGGEAAAALPAAGVVLGVATTAFAAAGGIAGGIIGYEAGEEAETSWEAAKMAANAVINKGSDFGKQF